MPTRSIFDGLPKHIPLRLESDGTTRNTRLYDAETGKHLLVRNVRFSVRHDLNSHPIELYMVGEVQIQLYFDVDVWGEFKGKRHHIVGNTSWVGTQVFDEEEKPVYNVTFVEWSCAAQDREPVLRMEFLEIPQRVGVDHGQSCHCATAFEWEPSHYTLKHHPNCRGGQQQ